MTENTSGTLQPTNSTFYVDKAASSNDNRPLAMVLIQAITMACIMVAGTLANGVILHCIIKHRSLRTITNAFIFNLAATDFLLSVLCMPFVFVSCIAGRWVFGSVLCGITGFLLSMFCIASILTLGLISIDRFMAIKRPLKYNDLITVQNSRRMIAYVWIQGAICSALPALGWGKGYAFMTEESICRPHLNGPTIDHGFTIFLFVTCFVVPFNVIAYTYVSILWTAHRQFRQVHNKPNMITVRPPEEISVSVIRSNKSTEQNMRANISEPHCTMICDEITSTTNTVRVKKLYPFKKARRNKTKARGFKMLLFIVAVFLICWSPHFILIFYASLHKQIFPAEVKALTTWLTFLNSACNPFLYGFLNGKFRVGLRTFLGEKLLCCRWTANEVSSRVFTVRS